MAAPAITRPQVDQRYRSRSAAAGLGRGLVLSVGCALLLAYLLGPIVWLVSSSIQTEAEIVSVPPHWIPDDPTLKNFEAIFLTGDKEITYDTRTQADPLSGGYIPSTAQNLLRVVKTKKTELLFLALFLRLLKPGARAAVIVPAAVVSIGKSRGSTSAASSTAL